MLFVLKWFAGLKKSVVFFVFFTFGILWGVRGYSPCVAACPGGHGQGSVRGEYSVSHAGSSRLQTTDLARS